MNNFKKTLLILTTFVLGSAFFSPAPESLVLGNDIIKGNWPSGPHMMGPDCMTLLYPDYEFGMGMKIKTVGQIQGYHPIMYATFAFDFDHPSFSYSSSVEVSSTDFYFLGTINGYDIYEAYIVHNAPLPEICPANYKTGNYTLSLSQFNGSNYEPYPVEEYNAPGDLFSNDFFNEASETEEGQKVFCCDAPRFLSANNESVKTETSIEAEALNSKNVSTKESKISVEEHAFKMFPNPFSSDLSLAFELSEPEMVHVGLLDATGRICLENEVQREIGKHQLNWDLSNLTPGLYLVNLKIGNKFYAHKVVKQ